MSSEETQNKTRNPLGWGYVEDALDEARRKRLLEAMRSFLGDKVAALRPPPEAPDIKLSAPRISPPTSLTSFVTTNHGARLLHAVGRSFRDLAALRTDAIIPAPDVVATPADENQLAQVLAWAGDKRLAVIPYGGGSSVVGGVNPEKLEDWRAAVTVDLRCLNGVFEVNERDRVVHAQAGIFGPDLDAALKPHGLTVRHYPQSYYHSTLGGWVATRGAGHFSTLRTKIEDRVQSLAVMTPDGLTMETLPVPASSIGPDPNRLWCGSEGCLGVIVDVRLRVVAAPTHRDSVAVGFSDFETALEATRAIVQAELWPAQMRVLDPFEHAVSAALAGRSGQGALMILGFEATRAVAAQRDLALEIANEHGGVAQAGADSGAGNWRDAFFAQPYMRDALLDHAVIADTFETAVRWSALPDFYQRVRAATMEAVTEVGGSGGVTCRVTHAYPDGAALYFTFYAPGDHDALIKQWLEIKAAGADAVVGGGGTMSHHHAMGRDHKFWAYPEVPTAYRAAIRGAKRALDPLGIMNPGLWFAD